MAFDDLLTTQVRRKLQGLRTALRAHLLGRGLCWVIVVLVASVFFTLGVDWMLRMDIAQRILMSALSLAGILYVTWRYLMRPLRVSIGTDDLALVLEDYYPQLDDRLISALQFAGTDPAETGASEAMVRKVAEQANQLAADLNPREPIASATTWKRMSWPGAALLVLIVFAVFNPDIMGLWFKRNVLFGDQGWPQDTYLDVKVYYGSDPTTPRSGREFSIGAGETIRIDVGAEGVLPPAVTFHMDFPSLEGEVREAIEPVAAGSSRYVKTIKNLSESFEFRVTGNDAETETFKVTVLPPPELIALTGSRVWCRTTVPGGRRSMKGTASQLASPTLPARCQYDCPSGRKQLSWPQHSPSLLSAWAM